MKYIAYFMVVSFLIVAFSSCDNDPCEDVICFNNGTPQQDGNGCRCLCKDGFDGNDCSIEDKCESMNVDCSDQGVCVNGICDCNAGYEGDSCQTEIREKFLGDYLANDTCSSQFFGGNYQISIGDNGAILTQVIIGTGFSDNFTDAVAGKVDGLDIVVEEQFLDGTSRYVEGVGSISGNTIIWSYTITDTALVPNLVTTCTGTWEKL